MTRFAIDHLTALRIVREGVVVHPEHSLVAPNLLRSHALSHLYRGVANGEIERAEAKRWLDGIATLRIRLAG